MCGRFNLRANPRELAAIFALLREPIWEPRFNIAPTQSVLAIREVQAGVRTCDPLRWGLVPFWAKDLSIGSRMINARSETVDTSKAFKPALKSRRCIIPASGFYEWETITGSKTKQPWHIYPKDGSIFSFAGLWESWKGPGDQTVETCTILTTEANEFMTPVHNRMPVILADHDISTWLNPLMKDIETLKPLFAPCPNDWLERHKVSTIVNNPRNESVECLNSL